MRSFWLLAAFLVAACATPSHIVSTADDRVVGLGEVADDLARADVVVLGELHRTPAVHRTHHALIEALHERRGDLVIAMEMFERDVQTVLLQYLAGMVDEGTFLATARPWPDYRRDYRPIVEYAKANGLVVLAANAPRPLASRVAKEGLAAVAGNPDVARETTAPEDDYWDAFAEAMHGHPGSTPESTKRMYAAQCLKDDTMAESITDYLQKIGYLERRSSGGQRPLVVLICGRMHSDHGRGAVARIKSRMPELDVRVLSAEVEREGHEGAYGSPRSIGQYVVWAPRAEAESESAMPTTTAPPLVVEPSAAAPAATVPAVPAVPPVAATSEPAPTGRPGLGLMPEYNAGLEAGVQVGMVSEGGAADNAGIEAGDVILKVAGVVIEDVEHYTEVLDTLTIGKAVPVVLRRAGAEVELQVKVAARRRP